MRKDVRIGLSIGGVLLAVLIVYLLVPKDANTNRNNAQQVAQKGAGTGTSAQPGGDTSAVTGQGATGQGAIGQGANGAADPGQSPSHAGSGAAGDTSPGQGQQDSNLARTLGSTPGPDGTAPTGGTDASAQAEAGGVDWATILNRGVMPESMMATRHDPFADDTKRNADTPRNTPGPQPDWMTAGSAGGSTGQTSTGNGPAGNTPAGGSPTAGAVPHTLRTPAGSSGLTTGGVKDHTIQRGETFSSISLAVYGDPRYWKEIKKANPNVDDTRLKPGTVIKLPEAAAVKAAHSPAANAPANAIGGTAAKADAAKADAAIDPTREYRVQPSDSLHKIALKLYGKAAKADAIYELNRERIGGDSSRIKVGMVLKLPEAPTLSPTAKR
jgi:nucleoid-associated protein YgaU